MVGVDDSRLMELAADPPERLLPVLDRASAMAPLVVFAAEPVYKGGQREYREHCEVVLFDEGVNVWTHGFNSAGPHWILAAYWRFPLEANIAHRLQVQREGAQLKMILGDRIFGCVPAGLPATVFAGITACEGVNRFYEFGIEA